VKVVEHFNDVDNDVKTFENDASGVQFDRASFQERSDDGDVGAEREGLALVAEENELVEAIGFEPGHYLVDLGPML
jgi:hypothetical protein